MEQPRVAWPLPRLLLLLLLLLLASDVAADVSSGSEDDLEMFLTSVMLAYAAPVTNERVFDRLLPEAASERVVTGALPQQRDHFTYQTMDAEDGSERPLPVFAQRYYVNSTFWHGCGPQSPVILVIGGPSELPISYVQAGLPMRLAQRFGAMVIALEHRYYGMSSPYPDTKHLTPQQLMDLTSQQALADIAFLIDFIRIKYACQESPWVAIGSGFGGTLATWFRAKYPHLTAGAVALDAPLTMTPSSDFQAALRRGLGPVCGGNVQGAFQVLESRLGTQDLRNRFHFLRYIGDVKYNNWLASVFLQHVSLYVTGAARHDFLVDSLFLNATRPLESLCMLINNAESLGPDAVAQALADWMHQALAYEHESKVTLRTVDRALAWQICTEYGWLAGEPESVPLFSALPSRHDLWSRCSRYFDSNYYSPHFEWADQYYGGLDIDVSHMLLVHDKLDPYYGLSFYTATGSIRVINAARQPHGAVMFFDLVYPGQGKVPDSLESVLEHVEQRVESWIRTSPIPPPPSPRQPKLLLTYAGFTSILVATFAASVVISHILSRPDGLVNRPVAPKYVSLSRS